MSDDERPRGSCVIPDCPRDPYRREDGRAPLVCGPDVGRLRYWLSEIPVLCDELQAKSAPEEVTVRAEVRETLVSWTAGPGWHPPLVLARMVRVEQLVVAGALPAAGVAGAARGGPVSGSPVRRLPIDEDAVDLLAARRSLRRTPGEDDIGFLSIASTLDFWVQDLRDHRDRGEGLPVPSVTALSGWLLDRIDEAADDWLPIDEMFDDVRRAHGALRGQLGLVEPPRHQRGVPCPKCQVLSALVRLDTAPGEPDRIECSACAVLLSPDEYERYVKSLSMEEQAKKRQRKALLPLLASLHAAGWSRTASISVEGDGRGGQNVFTTYCWRRGDDLITAHTVDGRGFYGDVSYLEKVFASDQPAAGVLVGAGWVAEHGVARLARLASVVGVLSVPKERV